MPWSSSVTDIQQSEYTNQIFWKWAGGIRRSTLEGKQRKSSNPLNSVVGANYLNLKSSDIPHIWICTVDLWTNGRDYILSNGPFYLLAVYYLLCRSVAAVYPLTAWWVATPRKRPTLFDRSFAPLLPSLALTVAQMRKHFAWLHRWFAGFPCGLAWTLPMSR